MSKPRSGRIFIGPRATDLAVERVHELPEAPLKPLKRITSRLRLERVPVQPFVPSSLYAYVDRVRVRQRLRWALLILGLMVAGIALSLCRAAFQEQHRLTTHLKARTAPRFTGHAALASSASASPPLLATVPTAARPRPNPATAKAPSTTGSIAERREIAPKKSTATAGPLAGSASTPPKVQPDAPAPSPSSPWWY